MAKPRVLRVKNWEKFQHYKSGRLSEPELQAGGKDPLPWLELHHRYLDDFDLMSLSLETRAISLMILMLARRTFNAIPDDPVRIAFWLKCSTAQIKRALGELLEAGFIEQDTEESRQDQDRVKTESRQSLDHRTGQDRTGQDNNLVRLAADDLRISFDRFWQAYPRKIGKKRAREVWQRLKVRAELWAVMERAIEVHKATDQWQEGYIPHPSTWLNGARWEDEVDGNGDGRTWFPSALTGPPTPRTGEASSDAET